MYPMLFPLLLYIIFEEILDDTNTNKDVFADSAYRSKGKDKVY